MGPFDENGVCAVIVTYAPDMALLRRVLASVLVQAGHVVIFDNSGRQEDLARQLAPLGEGRLSVFGADGNIGLAAALNRACERAIADGYRYVLLMDQDSELEAGMVQILGRALLDLQRGQQGAAVGPLFRDARSGQLAPFVRLGFPFNHKDLGGPGAKVRCDFLITSGALIPVSALQQVGGMDEGLFIDSVDLDWSFRAQAAGLSLFGVCDARMQHCIGESLRPSRLVHGGVVIHKPFRLYFMMRNRVLLYRRATTPRLWVLQDIPRVLFKLVGNGLFVPPRLARLRCMLRGVWDGAMGRSGGLPPDLAP